MRTITLIYKCNTGLAPAAGLVAKLNNAAVPVDDGQLALLQLVFVSDTTAQTGPHEVTRTIVLHTDAASDQAYPTNADLVLVTTDLMTGALSMAGPCTVEASAPAIT